MVMYKINPMQKKHANGDQQITNATPALATPAPRGRRSPSKTLRRAVTSADRDPSIRAIVSAWNVTTPLVTRREREPAEGGRETLQT